MTTLLTRILRDPQHCALCQLGQGRACVCEEKCRRARAPSRSPTPGAFWWAYALLILAVVLLWRAFA